MNDPYGTAETAALTIPMASVDTGELPVVEDPATPGPRHARPRDWWHITRRAGLWAVVLVVLLCVVAAAKHASSSGSVDGSRWAGPRTVDTVREPVPATSGHRPGSPKADRAEPRRAPVLPLPTRRRTVSPTPKAEKPHKATASPSVKPSKANPPARPRVVPAPTHTTPKPAPSGTCTPKPGGGDE